MATRKAICLVSGLFEEVNTPTDKLDFAGNSTSDLSEGTNQYYTNARARAAISVTDSGGDGSLSYDNSTGVITFTGPSASEVRAHLSVATGSGLTYNSTSGEFGTSAIPNSQLANSSITLGSTAIALGNTATTITGVTSLTSTTLEATNFVRVGTDGQAGGVRLEDNFSATLSAVTFEGSTADDFETSLTVVDPTADRTISLPDSTGTVALLETLSIASGSGLTYNSSTGQFGTSAIPNSQLANSNITIGTTAISLGGSSTSLTGVTSLTIGTSGAANSFVLDSNGITFEGSTAASDYVTSGYFVSDYIAGGSFQSTLTVVDPTADRTLSLPDNTGTLLSTGSSIANANLANSSITVGTTGIALGGSSTTLAGLTSVTSTAVITNDSGFRVRNNTDNTKQAAFDVSGITTGTTRTYTFPDASGTFLLSGSATFTDTGFRIEDNADSTKLLAFECSGISTSTTRTMTIPDENGTIATQDFTTALAIALG